MESAIPEHLRQERTRPARAPAAYVPSYASWTARLGIDVTRLTMVYFGVRAGGSGRDEDARAALATVVGFFGRDGGPGHHDVGEFGRESGLPTYVAIAYWADAADFEAWNRLSGADDWFASPEREDGGLGLFREILSPRASHFETIISRPDTVEGAANLADGISGEFREHGYWGGMRDRLPASQTDPLDPSGTLGVTTSSEGRRIHLRGHDKVAFIRSGQDWSETVGEERRLYLERVEPVLKRGMDFLRSEGREIGCYFNRSVRLLDAAGAPLEKTFSVSAWTSLRHLEEWASSHPTHLAIHGTFMSMVQAMDNDLRLRLYHEVIVLDAAEQRYEYVNYEPDKGC